MFVYFALLLALVWLVVFVHESAHLVAARLVGKKVFRFKVGLGPHLRFRIGGTEYCFGIVPFGGYVLMPGGKETYEILEELGEKDTFFADNPDFVEHVTDDDDWTWEGRFVRSAFIFAAGPLANLATAALMWWGASAFLPEGAATYEKVYDGAVSVLIGNRADSSESHRISNLELAAACLFGLSLLSGASNLIPVPGSDGFGILTCVALGFLTEVLCVRSLTERSRVRKKLGEWGGLFYVALLSFLFFLVLFQLWG